MRIARRNVFSISLFGLKMKFGNAKTFAICRFLVKLSARTLGGIPRHLFFSNIPDPYWVLEFLTSQYKFKRMYIASEYTGRQLLTRYYDGMLMKLQKALVEFQGLKVAK
jgi:hypothetical protein